MKHWEDHPEPVPTCFGCKVLGLQVNEVSLRANGIPTAKQHDRELQSYYDATRQGIEPRSTKSKDIDAAVKLSNEAGKAFDGISMTFKDQGAIMKNSENGMMDDMGMEEDLMPYPASDKQYPNAAKYSSYESVQTGAMGKAAK